MGINNPTVVITHHFGGTDAQPLADSSNATAQDVDSWHKARWPGFTSSEFKNDKGEYYHVGYQYIIEKSGKVVQCRGIFEEGAHVIGMNTKSIGVSFAGNFDLTLPTEAQMQSWYKLYAELQTKFPNIPTYPHRKYATKTCHGRLLKDDHFAVQYQIFNLTNRINQLKALLLNMMTGKRMK